MDDIELATTNELLLTVFAIQYASVLPVFVPYDCRTKITRKCTHCRDTIYRILCANVHIVCKQCEIDT